MGRAPCCDKSSVKKGPWSPEEDAKLKSYIHHNGTGGNWIALPQKIGLKRCGKSCRLRWLNYLRPNIKHGGFSQQEDNLISTLYLTIGSRWSIIAAQLPGRTDNDIKNYWNTRLKKKLLLGGTSSSRASKQKKRSNPTTNSTTSTTAAQLPPIPIPHSHEAAEEPRFNDYASIRNLLISLGGRFNSTHQYSTTTTTASFDLIQPQPQPQPAPSYNYMNPLILHQLPAALMMNHHVPLQQGSSAHFEPNHEGPDLDDFNYADGPILINTSSMEYDDDEILMMSTTCSNSINFTPYNSNTTTQGGCFLQDQSMMLQEEEDYFPLDKIII